MRESGALTSMPPKISKVEAETLCWETFGIKGTAELLGAERDQNFMIHCENGRRVVMKISNPDEDPSVSSLQTEALLHIGKREPSVPVPQIVPASNGVAAPIVLLPDGRRALTRAITCVEGEPLRSGFVSPEIAADLGRKVAMLDRALSDFIHPAERHELLWDMTQLPKREWLLSWQEGSDSYPVIKRSFERFCSQVAPHFDRLPWQAIHNDLNPQNVFAVGTEITGIIDFGDMIRAPRAIDPAIAGAYLMVDEDDPFRLSRIFLRAYMDGIELNAAEVELLPGLIAGRHLLTCLITKWRAGMHPENAHYIFRNERLARASLHRLDDVGASAHALLFSDR